MKLKRILGALGLVIAAALIATAVFGSAIRHSDGSAGALLKEAAAREAAVSAHVKAADKTAPSTAKKCAAALTSAQKAVSQTETACAAVQTLAEQVESGAMDDPLLALMLKSAADIEAGLSGLAEAEGLDSLRGAESALTAEYDARVMALFSEQVKAAFKAVADAESQLKTACGAIADVYAGAGLAYEAMTAGTTAEPAAQTVGEALAALESLKNRAAELEAAAAAAAEEADRAQTAANGVRNADSQPLKDKAILLIGRSFIGIMLTGVIVLIVSVIALFFSARFARAWKRLPVFSTFISALVMIVIQTYSLGFDFSTYGEWGAFWLGNMLNVLRSNSSVGMIALGMTFVIITGGIDLAVGSSLAGIATVVMVLLDVSPNGILTGAGVTGVPNYVIAIAAGLLTGAALGALTGLGITKGRIPPFIFTLGMMNIIRSVAQYFTKSYKPEVPKGFQVIANTEVIGGQMLLPIIYWLILAVIMYVVAKHTAFGRHIYAVGSNERTSRLSGINVGGVKMKVYMLMGVIVAIASIVSVARLRGVDVASAGSGYEMNAIAAVIVGGTSMAGGRGSIVGTVLGVLIIGIMNNLLVLLHIDAFLSQAFTGAIIIFAVFMQRKERQ